MNMNIIELEIIPQNKRKCIPLYICILHSMVDKMTSPRNKRNNTSSTCKQSPEFVFLTKNCKHACF